MSRRSATVGELAQEAGIDTDEALVILWDAGVDSVTQAADLVSTGNWRRARRSLGLPMPSDLRRPSYWQERLMMGPDEFGAVLESVGVTLNPRARSLPSGSVKKLRAIERERFGGRLVAEPPIPPSPGQTTYAPHIWHVVGREVDVAYISVTEVEKIHYILVKTFANSPDPISPPGVKNRDLLASAVFRQHTSFGDDLKYPTSEMAAAALLHSLVINHAFHNGNKRTALVSMAVLLYENRIRLTCSPDELFKIVLRTAQRKLVDADAPQRADREVLILAEWIDDHSRRIEKGERILTWLQLKKILHGFGVRESYANVGNRINLERKVVRSAGFLRRQPKPETLRTQVGYRSDGTDVPKNTVSKIRRDLELDPEHGYDSEVFYEDKGRVQSIVVEYQSVLRRLAKL